MALFSQHLDWVVTLAVAGALIAGVLRLLAHEIRREQDRHDLIREARLGRHEAALDSPTAAMSE